MLYSFSYLHSIAKWNKVDRKSIITKTIMIIILLLHYIYKKEVGKEEVLEFI